MEEKRYLKWYNKAGYGCGDIAGNVVYALLAEFVMIFLTDTVGLNAGIVGVLIAFVVSVAAIKFLTGFIKKHSFAVFGWYRIILGAIVLGAFIFSKVSA